MKRRILCFIISLALCLNLCPVWALAADGESGGNQQKIDLNEDMEYPATLDVSDIKTIITNGHTLSGTCSPIIRVNEGGELHLSGVIASQEGVGVEVQAGGSLTVTEAETSVTGAPYGLDIASGADVHLAGGRFSGTGKAIRVADGNFAALLEKGCAFYDGDNKLLLPADAAKAKVFVVGACSGHSDHGWTHKSGSTEHSWTCLYCGAEEMKKCTFSFDEDGHGTCDVCGSGVTITVSDSSLADLVYDGTVKPGNPPPITVALADGSNKELVKDTDYKFEYKPTTDAGVITVTVTGITFDGTFTKTYEVKQAKPGISWDDTTKTVDYDGSEVDELPNITITIPVSEDLHPFLQYFYRKTGETEFTPGLPTNAGTYEVKAYLEESQNYMEAETDPCLTLTINKIPAVSTAPTALTLTYNREAQELVTAGALKPGAAAEGAKIEFKLGMDGDYSTDIPTGVGVSSYNVYYRVAETENYSGVSETLVLNPDPQNTSARINHREIKPTIELEYYTTVYTGGDKEPVVTAVKDGEYVIPKSEYTVAYSNNRNVGKATVTISNASNGNYKLTTATATFQITNKPQDSLTITQKPNSVTYGDKFTLGTQGGSGNGDVAWEIIDIDGVKVAEVGAKSGQVTIVGDGEFTVKATKSGTDADVTNYETATATWTVSAEKKKVTATVTAEDKFYDGNTDATIYAVVGQGVLPGDEITITGLTGTFNDENAGVGKTVTVVTSGASISGTNSQHYAVSYSSTSVKATINKAVVHITTAPGAAELTYSGEAQPLIDASVLAIDLSNLPADSSSVLVEYALSENGTYSPEIPKGTNAGAYTVWYRVQETSNYTGLAPDKVDVTINKKSVTPTITLSGDGLTVEGDNYSYIYDGNAKEPAVTLTESDGKEIPASNYTVKYSDNVNVGTSATVTVTAKADGNYTFTNAPVTTTFEIKKEQAKVLTAPEAAGDPLTFSNRAQKLVTAGTGVGGKMVYSLDKDDEDSYSEDIPTGKDAKDYTVYYKVAGDGNHSDSDVGSVDVTIAPKTVKDPTIELLDDDGNTLVSYTYDGSKKEPEVIVKDGSTVIDPSEYNVVYSNNTDAGNGLVSITDKTGGDYTVTGSATFVIVKADIVFNPAPSAAGITYDGKAHELLVPGTTSGGEVLYALNSPTSTYTAAIPTATEAGNYTVYYKVTGDKNHNDFAVQSVPVTIQRKELSAITIELSPEGFAYDGSVKMPSVTVKDGNTVLPETEYTWACNVASPTNVGTYTITVSDKADGNYDLSKLVPPANEATFTIGQIAQEALVIGGKPAATNYGDSFQLSVSGGSGDGAVTWEASGSASVDTVDADGKATITISDVGEVTITVKKGADTNYLAAKTEWTFTAAPKPVTATIKVADKPFDGNTDAAVASAIIGTINNDEVTIAPTSITAEFDTPAVGEGKTVTLDTSKVKVDGAAAGKYAISYPATVKADITQAAASITKDPEAIAPLTYDGTAQPLVKAGQTNVGFIVYSLDGTNFSPEIPTGTNAYTYNVYYKVDGTADYTGVAVNTTPVTVTIAPKSITPVIELSEDSYLYDSTKKNPTITVKDDETVIDKKQYSVTWAGTKNQTDAEMLTVADTYTATIENVANGNYTFSETVTVEIVTAEQAALNITGKPDHVYYGDTVTTLGTTGGSGNGTVTWSFTAGGTNSTIDPASGKLTVKDTGSITVKAERVVPNYGTVSDTWTFNVEPKPVTAVVTITPKFYDGTTDIADGAIRADVKDEDLVLSDDSISITGLKGDYDNANAGTGKEVALDRSDPGFTINCDTDKYTIIIPGTATASITPRAVSVTVELSDHDLQTDNKGYFYIYDGNEKEPSVTVNGEDGSYEAKLADSDYTVIYANNKNASTETVTATATVKSAAGGNYTFADKTVTFEIRNGAAVLTESPKAKDLTYDGTAQDLVTVGTATGGNVVYSSTGAAGSYSETIPQETGAGTYTVYYMVKGDGNHDDTAPGQVSVTIKPKTITPKITLNPASYVYDGNECKPTVTVEDGSDTIAASEYSVDYRDNTNAGKATVIVNNANGGNYIVNGTATFEITKKAPVITPPEGITGLQYNGAPQELIKAGVSHDGTVVYSVNGGNFSAAIPTATARGDYEISYKVLGDANHSDTDPVTLDKVTIAKNTVNNPVISLSSEQFTFNGGQQKPTIDVYDDNGNLIPKNEYTATIAPTPGGDAGIVNVGTYTVTIITPDSSNYVITTNNTKTFEIVPANQETISITGTKAQVRYGDTIQLGVTGSGAGTVTWTVTGNSTISANGLLEVKDVGGSIKVTVERTAANHNTVSASWEFSAAKKPVTAVVTADDKVYDGVDPATTTVHITWKDGDLVFGDSINITNVTGEFDNPNVGQNKKVTVKSADASVGGTNAEHYEITIPATTTASITAEAATVDTAPTPNNLTYDASQAQALVTAGEVTGGIMVYSLDRSNFTPSIPKAKDAGTYTVYFKAQGDGNHTDSEIKSTPVTIGKQPVTPQIELSPSNAKYDGEEHKPDVTLWDGANNEIPTSEYKVTYVTDGGKNWTDKGEYTVKIEDINRGNYVVATAEKTFTISTTAQNPLEITNKPGLVYYGNTFTLSAVGGSGNAAVTWSVDDAGKSVVEIDDNGFVKIIGTGPAVIKAEKSGGANYDTATATYPLNALKKPVTAIVSADDQVYTGAKPTTTTLHFSWNGLVGTDTIGTTNMCGEFADENVGTNKTVNITGTPVDDATAKKYDITIPSTTTASILKADTSSPNLTASTLTYTGSSQNLVSGGDDNTRYSDSRDGVYSATIPTGTSAGTYTVWYKELGDANHNDSAPEAKTVTISPKKLDPVNITLSGNDLQTDNSNPTTPKYSYVYDGTEKKPTVTILDGAAVVPSSEYTVGYDNNKNVSTDTATAKVIIASNEGGNYTFDEQTVTFTITSAAAQLASSPLAKDLTYTGQSQELVTVGTAVGGHIEYSLDGTTYSKNVPTKTDAGTYTVTYKVVGDGNYANSGDTWTVSVTIRPKEIVSPKVTVSGIYTYNGNPQEPEDEETAVVVMDGTTTIPTSEYDVSYRDNVNAGTATAVITNANGGNYIVNGTGSFTIGKDDASVGTAPTGKKNLPYNGTAQALAEAGSASGGTMVYSLSEDGEYSPVIPTATAKGNYTVYYKVQGDNNHKDTDPALATASIIVNTATDPTVQVTPEAVTYNGKKQEPTVKITDKNGFVIDGSEYTVTYADSEDHAVTDPTDVGKYTLTITGKADGNYTFTFTEKPTFEILPADQTPLTITGTRERVCYGDTIQLGTSGGSGTITWKVENPDGSTVASINNGLLTITGVGSVTVTATSSATGYADQTATWSFFAEKKPVTAVVTAESKTYDSKKDAAVTATLQDSDRVNGDEKITITLKGSFEDANAGPNKKVTIDSTEPGFPDGKENIYENYNITYPATATASIFKADIKAEDVTAPTAKSGLTYTGLAQSLVTAGSATDGTLEYSMDGLTYSASLPTGTDADSYNVWYRVKGDGNHNDTAGEQLDSSVTIAQQEVKIPTIELKPTGASYDGAVHKPDVTVKDNNGRTIPTGEYTFDYGEGDWKTVGKYKVKITDAKENGGNYDITAAEAEFEILATGQSPLSITDKPGTVHYGDSFTLSAVGGSGTGTIKWEVTSGTDVAEINQNGLVKILKSGSVTITATKLADGNYGESTASWTFSAEKRSAQAVVTAKNKVYDTTDDAQLEISWKDGDLLGNDTVTLDLTGTFDSADVGNNKTVTIRGTAPSSDKYEISFNGTTTASITSASAEVTAPTVKENLIYTGQAQPLVNGGSATNGTIQYSLDGIIYGPNIPKGTNADSYTVWYKVEGNANYADVAPKALPVTISPKTVNLSVDDITLSVDTFDYDGSPKRPDVVAVKDGNTVIPASEYLVGYSNNVNKGNATVIISDAEGGNYIVSGSKTFTIKAGNAILTSPPLAKDLTYDGTDQELVTGGIATNGKVVYRDRGTGEYSEQIPTAEDAGKYTVYYKVQSDNGTSDTSVRSITVTIKPKPVKPLILLDLDDDTAVYTGQKIEPELLVRVDGKKLIEGRDYEVYYRNNKNVGTATVMVWNTDSCNYEFDTTVTFEIVREAAEFDTRPAGNRDLVYTAAAQDLIMTPGTPKNGGIVLYSLDGVTYSALHPTGTEVKTYTIYAKVLGDSTHADSTVVTTTAVISKNPITADKLTATLSGNSFKFTGSEIKPTVTLTDGSGNIIPADEYTVSYSGNIDVGEATVTITSKGKNYGTFTKTATFQITESDKPALTITGKPEGKVCYGDTFTLSTTGGSGNGAVTWSSSDENIATVTNGVVTIKKSGNVKITATKGVSTRDADSANTATWEFYAYAKPVTAIVTAKSKTYDGNDTATLTFTLSGLVSGESVTSVTATGQFVDTNVGTQTVIVTMSIPNEISAKYDISYPATVTANITAAEAKVTDGKAPTGKTGLQYTGEPLELVDKGEATGGKIKYSLDGETYTYAVPTGTDAKSYTVWYKVVADDSNYKDSKAVEMAPITIAPNTSTPTVVCKSATFTGAEQTPTVIVTVNNRTLPEDEYTVKITGTPIAVGKYDVTVTDKSNYGNYEFGTATSTFEIVQAGQNLVSIVTDKYNVTYGDTFRVSATGGSGTGAIEWRIAEGGDVATINSNGVVTVIGTGPFTVEAYRKGAGNYSDSNTDTAPFFANKKTVMPTVTAENKSYDRNATAKLKAVWKPGDLVGDDIINLNIEDGTFETSDVGTNKTVTFGPGAATGDAGVVAKYDIKWPESTTASIYKIDTKIENAPEAVPDLTYKKDEAQALVTGGSTVDGIGTIVYSTSEKGSYSESIPTGTNAGTYSVWYKVADSINYTGIPAAEVKVEIKKATPTIQTNPTTSSISSGQLLSTSTFTNNGTAQLGNLIVDGTFAWKDGNVTPPVGTSKQEVIFTPDDTANYNKVTIEIDVTVTAPSNDNSGTTQAQTQTTIRNGTANTVLSASDGSRLVREAVANQSQSVVIKPNITGDVSKSEVSIPSSTVSKLSSDTDAALTVSSPVADVTIPNKALDTLGQAGGSVSVAVENAEQSVVLTVASGGETVKQVPGGLTLSVPVEDPAPGTVAVLVNEDGTRETVRNSVVADGVMSIPLSGSATVEIVDNSKDFDDVPPESWEADAVDFASSHELFGGTSETTFSPDMAMSRGMLATVLYRLEGNPELDLTDAFSDVSDGAWYADGVAWAAENGIVGGYGDGQFGPNDDITREQFVVMLWRYAGSPEAGSQTLDFLDANQASSYATEALCWAVENGILNGVGGGILDPRGTATRAQAAQLLKNFMEKT